MEERYWMPFYKKAHMFMPMIVKRIVWRIIGRIQTSIFYILMSLMDERTAMQF